MQRKPQYYECGICGAMHSAAWDGDCREDAARLNIEDLDRDHGLSGWDEIEMPGLTEEEAREIYGTP